MFSVLVLVLLSRYEPADAVGAQYGVQSESSDEEDGEDQQPVDALHRDTGQRTQPVCVCHVSVGARFKTCSTNKGSLSGNIAHKYSVALHDVKDLSFTKFFLIVSTHFCTLQVFKCRNTSSHKSTNLSPEQQ